MEQELIDRALDQTIVEINQRIDRDSELLERFKESSLFKGVGSNLFTSSFQTIGLKTVDFIRLWAANTSNHGRVGDMYYLKSDATIADCKEFCKEKWEAAKNEREFGSVLGLIFLFVIARLISDWIVERFFYHLRNQAI